MHWLQSEGKRLFLILESHLLEANLPLSGVVLKGQLLSFFGFPEEVLGHGSDDPGQELHHTSLQKHKALQNEPLNQ